jgi:hypothetical protein
MSCVRGSQTNDAANKKSERSILKPGQQRAKQYGQDLPVSQVGEKATKYYMQGEMSVISEKPGLEDSAISQGQKWTRLNSTNRSAVDPSQSKMTIDPKQSQDLRDED